MLLIRTDFHVQEKCIQHTIYGDIPYFESIHDVASAAPFVLIEKKLNGENVKKNSKQKKTKNEIRKKKLKILYTQFAACE